MRSPGDAEQALAEITELQVWGWRCHSDQLAKALTAVQHDIGDVAIGPFHAREVIGLLLDRHRRFMEQSDTPRPNGSE